VKHAARIAVLMMAAAIAAGCDSVAKRVVPGVTATKADWAFVDRSWGGTKLQSAAATDRDLTITLALGVDRPKQIDSETCTRGVHARQDGSRIVLSIDRSVCGDGPHPSTATIAKPAVGTYDVVYDDASAGFPRVGRLIVGSPLVTIAPP
jgi:hypothetical protein